MATDDFQSGPGESPARPSSRSVVFAGLLIGLVVLICAEVFSGASLQIGIWNLWTLIVTYWLYFTHFFCCTTLAVRTGRTSLWALYLWGVLFGLYESWITKVIWAGYSADGKFALGQIGPYGFSEISMVFIFHPVMSFLIPLAVACVLWPSLGRWFPDLAWFTGTTRGARLMRAYLVFSTAPVVALNSGGPLNLALNVAFVLVLWWVLCWLARPSFAAENCISIVAFGRWGFLALCAYLTLLYSITYRFLRFEALPSVPIQLLTFVFYAIAILGIYCHRRRVPLAAKPVSPEPRERLVVVSVFALVIGLGLVLAIIPRKKVLLIPFVISSVLWPILGFLFTGFAVWRGIREFRDRAPVYASG
jgi:hypothetical protein